MDLNHARCDCHACTQQRATEGLGSIAAGIQKMNNISMIEMLRQAIREELEAREKFEVK